MITIRFNENTRPATLRLFISLCEEFIEMYERNYSEPKQEMTEEEKQKVGVFFKPALGPFVTNPNLDVLENAIIAEDKQIQEFKEQIVSEIGAIDTEAFQKLQNKYSDLDAEGMPWDERIHASTKTKTATGVWKAKRGVDKTLVTLVRQSYQNGMTAQPLVNMPQHQVGEPIAKVEQPDPYLVYKGPQVTPIILQETQSPTQPAVTIPTPPAPPIEPEITYAQLMSTIDHAVVAGRLNHSDVLQILKQHGFESLVIVPSRKEMIPVIYQDILKIIKPVEA